MKGTKTRKGRTMCKNKSVYHYGKSTHAIFMSVGFGILVKKKPTKKPHHHCYYVSPQTQEEEVFDYNIYIKSAATYSWSLSRT